MITLKELKDWIATLPEEFETYGVVSSDIINIDDKHYGRKDTPIRTLSVDEDSNEVCLFNKSLNDLDNEEKEEKEGE